MQERSYYDYESAVFPPSNVPIKSTNDYMLIRRLGAGKFSDVFEAVDLQLENALQRSSSSLPTPSNGTIDPRSLVVLKCLKPVAERKIKRELLVLQHASKLPNLARLLAVVVPPDSMPTLVLEHAHGDWLCHPTRKQQDQQMQQLLSEDEIRFYLFHLLVALDGLHACGIMHRDVKPRNVLINRAQRTTTLIDLGLADFYLPSQQTNYNVRVASRHYKSPELLVGHEAYDYAIDIWGVGCILAGLLLRKEPFFRGKDNMDQLGTIVAVLGTTDFHMYMSRYKLKMTPEIREVIAQKTLRGGGKKQDWTSFVTDDSFLPCAEGIDLLSKLLRYDPDQRLTAKQAMQHPFFDPVRIQIERQLLERQRMSMSRASLLGSINDY